MTVVTVNRATPSGQSNYEPGYDSVQNEWFHPFGNSLFNDGPETNPATAQYRARQLEKQSLGYHVVHSIGWGRISTWPLKADGGPTYWDHLDEEMGNLVNNAPAIKPVLGMSMAPFWMMGERTAGNGVIPCTTDFGGNYFVSRVLTDEMANWELLTLETVKRYAVAPYNTRLFFVWNELKGFGNVDNNDYDSDTYAGTAGKADMGYTYFYNRTYAKIREAFTAVGLDPDLAEVGGPYVVADLWDHTPIGGTADIPSSGPEAHIHSSSTVLTGSKPYGWVDARPLRVIEEWLRLKTDAQFIILRSGNGAKPVGKAFGDEFEGTQWFTDQLTWLRGLAEGTYPGATTLPVWNIEQYIDPVIGPPWGDPSWDQNKRAAMHATAVIRQVKAGFQSTMYWGANQEFHPGIWTTAPDPANGWDRLSTGMGEPWPMYSILKALKDNFPPGTNFYPATVDQPTEVEVLAGPNGALVVNKLATTNSLTLDGAAYSLAGYEVQYIARAATNYSQTVLDDTPLLYWRLGETSGTTAADLSGNSRTGTYSGQTLSQAGAVSDDLAVLLDVTAGRVKANASLQLGTGSIEVWLYVTALPAADATVSTFNDNDDLATYDKTIYLQPDGKLRFYTYDGLARNTSVPATATVPLNTWTHIVATFDGTTNRLYQNGVEIGTVAAGPTYTGYAISTFSVGYRGGGGGAAIDRLAGRRDEAALYSTVLSPAQVLEHFNAAVGPYEKSGVLVADTVMASGHGLLVGRQATLTTGSHASGLKGVGATKTGKATAGVLPKAPDSVTWQRLGKAVSGTLARAADSATVNRLGKLLARAVAAGFAGAPAQVPDTTLPLTVTLEASVTTLAITPISTSVTLVAPSTSVAIVPANQTLLVEA